MEVCSLLHSVRGLPHCVSYVLELNKPACFSPNPSLATPDTLGKHVGVDGTCFYKEVPSGP